MIPKLNLLTTEVTVNQLVEFEPELRPYITSSQVKDAKIPLRVYLHVPFLCGLENHILDTKSDKYNPMSQTTGNYEQ